MAITDIKKKKAKPFIYLHGTVTVAYEKVPEGGGRIMDALQPLVEGKDVLAGPSVWTYRDGGPGKLVLRAGFQVKSGTRGKAGYAARKEPEWHCLSAMYKGPMPRIIDAWHALMEHAESKGIECSDERREIYLKWVGVDSKANVTELQLRLRK